jgi:hypothetical protein
MLLHKRPGGRASAPRAAPAPQAGRAPDARSRGAARDYHTIYKMVYHDLQGALQREAAAHLTAEGERAYAAFAAECPDGPPGIALKARRGGLVKGTGSRV